MCLGSTLFLYALVPPTLLVVFVQLPNASLILLFLRFLCFSFPCYTLVSPYLYYAYLPFHLFMMLSAAIFKSVHYSSCAFSLSLSLCPKSLSGTCRESGKLLRQDVVTSFYRARLVESFSCQTSTDQWQASVWVERESERSAEAGLPFPSVLTMLSSCAHLGVNCASEPSQLCTGTLMEHSIQLELGGRLDVALQHIDTPSFPGSLLCAVCHIVFPAASVFL